ncbi:hypothetical protein JXA02_08385 [candidate division KSB1 bacterium]|nr:hypothetical protein [candidate division KSB1 bacterium]RQW05445.1 MAG: hypothetical protein EH222_09885 [candidate division KSB1 bacterium]
MQFQIRFLLLLAVLLAACSRDKSPICPPADAPMGTYSYASYDTTEHMVARGWLTIDSFDSLRIAGEWHISKVGDPHEIGMQIGEGELVGAVQQSSIWINLNPDWVDNNVWLDGVLSDHGFEGTWTWATIAGPTSSGRFAAIKR